MVFDVEEREKKTKKRSFAQAEGEGKLKKYQKYTNLSVLESDVEGCKPVLDATSHALLCTGGRFFLHVIRHRLIL